MLLEAHHKDISLTLSLCCITYSSIALIALEVIIFFLLHHLQMRTFMQIWSQKNPVQELRIVPINLEESLSPREQCVRRRQTWRYSYKEFLKDSI